MGDNHVRCCPICNDIKMCGIFFSIGFEDLSANVIDSVAHRGPDGRGWNEFTSPKGPVVMAHRRLAIVDLSTDGHQPMSTEDKRFWVTYNGEIYNYLEIRKELEELGYQFKTKTDTEVLLKSYLHWGRECLHKFNGMFAFVIWDDKEKIAFAVRDRFGVKPLYYYKQGDKIAFASEIKQFKNIFGWVSEINEEAADHYLKLGFCDHERETLYKNVFQILPGEQAVIDKEITISRWYDLRDYETELEISDQDAIEQFKFLFEDAIRLRLRSDVPVGACLSGGIDSTSIVSMLRKIQETGQNIYTFSSVFPGCDVDESTYIDELASKKNLNSHKNYPTVEEFIEKLDQVLYHQDLPFLGTSIFAQWKTFEQAKQHNVTVLLDGQGADESLLGYPGMLNGIVFDYLKSFQLINLMNFFKWQMLQNKQSVRNTVLLALQQRHPTCYQFLLKLKNHNIDFKEDPVRTITEMSFYHFTNNLQSLLRYEDRNSMAFSRESRLPFLDYRLVEFIISLQVRKKFRDTTTKWILRESMKDINLDSILNRKDKIGFATPEQHWWKKIQNENSIPVDTDFKKFIFNRWLKNEHFSNC